MFKEYSDKNKKILELIDKGLIVSCQALEDEPLHSSYIMSRMAYAAFEGGACGIRANSVADIEEIKKTVNLPLIGIIKKEYDNSEVYITPTMKEVDALVACKSDIIAVDATARIRPDNKDLKTFFTEVRLKYPEQLFMADCSTYAEALLAAELGFDLIGTTMHGYTSYTAGAALPNFELLRALVKSLGDKVIAEGGIWSPDDLKKAMDTGVKACVVGSAITRPREITKKYVQALKK